MKKLTVALLLTGVFFFQFCSTSRKAQKEVPKVTYASNVQPIISTQCTPCHIPPGGKVTALNTYAAATKEIDDIIRRIQLNPGEKGFMPMKHPKLPDSTIQVFVHWKADGLLEK
jgi:hypothetical protein